MYTVIIAAVLAIGLIVLALLKKVPRGLFVIPLVVGVLVYVGGAYGATTAVASQTTKNYDILGVNKSCETCPVNIASGYIDDRAIYLFYKVNADGTNELSFIPALNVLVFEDQTEKFGYVATTHFTYTSSRSANWFMTPPSTLTQTDVVEIHIPRDGRVYQFDSAVVKQALNEQR